MQTKSYLEYLDKEMSIMGILCAASAVASAGVLTTLLGDHSTLKEQLWTSGRFFIITGCVFCIVAAFWFYWQRATLAWFYGQICLAEALAAPNAVDETLREWLTNADSWATWVSHDWGLTFLFFGFLEYLAAVSLYLVRPFWHWNPGYFCATEVALFCVLVSLAAIVATLQWHVMTRYEFSDDCWAEFWSGEHPWRDLGSHILHARVLRAHHFNSQGRIPNGKE